ncbi:MAG: hypothetical protein P8077_01205 [Gammaproteobacteria bacterium]
MPGKEIFSLTIIYKEKDEKVPNTPELIMSPLCQTIERDGNTLEIYIYQDDEKKWILETVDVYGNSYLFDHHFSTDNEALEELLKIIKSEGIEEFIGEEDKSLRPIN